MRSRTVSRARPNRRCPEDSGTASKRESAVDVVADRKLASHAGDDDGVHAEGDAVERRIHPERGERRERLVADPRGRLVGSRDLTARARLHELQRDAVDDQRVDVILVEGLEAGKHDVRTKAVHR